METKWLMKYNTKRDQRKKYMNLVSRCKFHDHKGVFTLFGYQDIKFTCFVPVALAVSSGFFLAGCGGDQVRKNNDTQKYTDQSSAVFAPDPVSGQSVSGQASKAIGGWSIVLVKFGQNGMQRAAEMLQIIKDETKLDGAYVDDRSSGVVIAYGSYLDKSEPRAIKDLKRIKSIQLNGVNLFEAAIMTPPTSSSLMGSNKSYDLRTVKERYGERAIYTLQIGVYGRVDYQVSSAQDLAVYRQAAETAVRELRAQGVIAFYYHAPARSMVTVGVFSARDFDSSTAPPTQSLAMRKMRDQFPNNLLNGQGINETVQSESGRITRLQSSQLVGIPEK